MRRRLAAIVAVFLQACVSSRAPTSTTVGTAGDEELVRTVVGLAQDMAKNASEMHPERNAALIPDTDKVVYVSFGYPMTGKQYLPTLRDSYAKRRSLSQHWDRCDLSR